MIMNNNLDFTLTHNYIVIMGSESPKLEYPKLYNTSCINNWCEHFRYSYYGTLENILHNLYRLCSTIIKNIFSNNTGKRIWFSPIGRLKVL